MDNRVRLETTSMSLHIMAMVFMLCDHLWGTIIPGSDLLTCIGRISFPIFAFLIVEGYFHTRNLKKYVLRILLFALVSEIPFNLAMGSSISYPVHQNVLWTYLIAIGLIYLNEKVSEKGLLIRALVGCLTVIMGFVLGLLTMVDFYHAGVLTVVTFYFFRQKKWWSYIGQFVCLWYINTELLGGLGYEISIFGETYFFLRQGLALLALIPIWLYKGRQGYHSKALQYTYYAFYPVHLLILGMIKMMM